jgi:protein TonB
MRGHGASVISAADNDLGTARGEIFRWGACLLAVLAVHAAGAATLVDWRKPLPPLELPPPAVMIDLGEMQPAPSPPQLAAFEPLRPIPRPEPPTPPPPEAPKLEVPEVESEIALDQAKPKPPEPQKKKKKQKKEKPKPVETPPVMPAKPVEAAKETVAVPAKPAQAEQGAEAIAAAKKEAEMASLAAAAAAANWESQVAAHLGKFKRSPRMRHRRAMTAYIDVAIDRQGQILSRAIAQSSGDERLDEAALALVDRADPLPAPPPAYEESQLRAIKLPIVFTPR